MAKLSLAAIYHNPARVVVTAHRGFSGRFPENTLSAFEQAIKVGADIIEYDLHPSRELIPVVIHDSTVDRTTDGHGEVASLPLAALQQLNASWWQGSHAEGGSRRTTSADSTSRIPTFTELLESFAGRVGMNIHIKSNPPPEMLAEICRLFRHHDLYASAYLSLGSYTEGRAVRALDAQIPLCLLVGQNQMDSAAIEHQHKFGACCLQPGRQDVTPELCTKARSLGLPTNVFWANDDATVEKFVSAGVQGLLTDWPDQVLATLERLGRRP